ncbi:hypothetical protein HMPREF0083_02582 [Aneurinibacillus aneurinilyticus ATCC 12856]|uniref:Uncharacterized protein n=1 Tax=Aneurinibacillus aneurinilyticus ATCC 12856 TaxID=649747 RepID=U1X453_ANEAE|nr:hypothetical protein HMPREF0083_02582 [Aneurinibacillus aneurinilyticus ATCC 12856]
MKSKEKNICSMMTPCFLNYYQNIQSIIMKKSSPRHVFFYSIEVHLL